MLKVHYEKNEWEEKKS